jgi:hypothetical protein
MNEHTLFELLSRKKADSLTFVCSVPCRATGEAEEGG